MADSAPTADLDGWRRVPFEAAGRRHDVYEKGTGPGVVVLPELPGMTPAVLGFAEHLVARGFTVSAVSVFGRPGAREDLRAVGTMLRACVSAEFRALALNARRPFTDYLRALTRDLAARTPGPGVGVVGMCFTGGFALAAAVDDSVLAPVASQPSLPLPLGRARRQDPGLSEGELTRLEARTRESGLCLLGLRFTADRLVPGERFTALKERLGDAFEVIELDSGPGNADGFGRSAHSVLTREVREREGHPALVARERVVAFLRERLGG
ncbi:dienelactone hydrolase [Crossiella equi]|uniref:Dienelactone hydrolase n=1 Tax=Crossiella equi TaxID=130796 RepID=A0ABS5ALG3_9PSEU|nr:dienelactone hydrolase family protein [Crossiella equi]MBP2477107.1 dienelactone hydrolase [Crossiella equi]